jgi:hypothetical protein
VSHPAVDHPANAGLRRYREPRHERREIPAVALPGDVSDPYYGLGTHPDLVARLWDELPRLIPVDCRRVFFGAPALMHPETNVVFGFAGGTHTYALRLPEPEFSEARRAGAARTIHYPAGERSFDLDEIGPEWVFCRWFRQEEAWCLAAFELAAR